MKLYQAAQSTNPRRVIIYIAEKGIDVPRHEVDIARGEHKSPAFLRLNPAGKVPVLELGDGTAIPESAAIVEYLEEIYPDPPMLGTGPAERGRMRALERIASDLIGRAGLWFMHTHPHFAGRIAQQPDAGVAAEAYARELLGVLEAQIGEAPFLGGERPMIPDCTLFALFQTCRARFHVPIEAGHPRLAAWYDRFAERPSAAY